MCKSVFLTVHTFVVVLSNKKRMLLMVDRSWRRETAVVMRDHLPSVELWNFYTSVPLLADSMDVPHQIRFTRLLTRSHKLAPPSISYQYAFRMEGCGFTDADSKSLLLIRGKYGKM